MLIMVLGAVFMLAISIFIHELGHLLCGMLVGVKARIFSIGYGRGIWKKKVGETTYQITAIPVGGYVLFKGDDYGEDIKGEPGELLSTPPLKRMIPVLGGPLFNLFLGFGILLILNFLGHNPPGNRVFIDPADQEFSAAYQSGLRTGDRIFSIDGNKTEKFEDIVTSVGLSSGSSLKILGERDGKPIEWNVTPRIIYNPKRSSGIPTIGVEPFGERRVVATFSYPEQFQHWLSSRLDKSHEAENYYQERLKKAVEGRDIPAEVLLEKEKEDKENLLRSRALSYLNDGDVIQTVNGRTISTVGELQKILGEFQNQKVNIVVDRKSYPLVNPWSTEVVSVEIPVLGANILEFKNIRDRKYSELNLESYQFASYDPELGQKLLNLAVDGQTFPSFEELLAYVKTKNGTTVTIDMGNLKLEAEPKVRPIGLLGFRPNMKFNPEPMQRDLGFLESFAVAGKDVYENVETTLKGIGMLFSGILSVKDSLSGPVGIVSYAGISLEIGWETYLEFVARISIALMIMNLLPIPMADGGHIVLYAYEAITGRPLPGKVIESIFRIGFLFLLGLGLYVTFNDVMRIF
ncbi:site-2 protease family protein [Leptospira noguchii]|uniref:RIP metalloprotease RseP n=1 Tax=Leptospira noguchii str. 2007001578 TaxID=1049974 RepID=A0ABP2TEZ4_9LEPT|nr:site-2 protease family protein [Leptospira noguchii]EMN02837.1 putative RIP metalloprotease RseP [Leptospira noguchii str. 2007001578]